ncbi:MAG: hypothetical protein ABIR33_13150 [Pyrinomonadaceae bacterium]
MWKLKSFTNQEGVPIINKWFKNATPQLKAAFLTRMNDLKKLPHNGWGRPDVGQLRRECSGLYEIILFANDTQHRPIGYFSGDGEFTFLAFAIERGNRFEPANICETAHQRRKLVEDEKQLEKKRVAQFTLIAK